MRSQHTCGCSEHGGAPVAEAGSGALVTMTVDGIPVTLPAGSSVMAATVLVARALPRFCGAEMTAAFGSCRMCLVEIEGRNGVEPSCTTAAEPGMVVRTRSAWLLELRRPVFELAFDESSAEALADDWRELGEMCEAFELPDDPGPGRPQYALS